jgi:hypothetical protein
MSNPPKVSIRRIDWKAAQVNHGRTASDGDRQLLELLAEGKSTPIIARELGTHRSAIWRRIQSLKEQFQLTETQAPTEQN